MDDNKHRDLMGLIYQEIEMPGGWRFNHAETLRMINLYYNGQYKTGKYDSEGFRKFFYNVVQPTCDIATKFIDLDTRDIILTPEHANDELRVFLMQRRLKQYLKETNFGVFLNDLTYNWPIYGHIVAKKSRDGWVNVPIMNIRCNPKAKGLVSDTFAEVYTLTIYDMELLGWDLEELKKRPKSDEYLIYDIFERRGNKWHREVKADLWSKKDGKGINRAVESEINQQRSDYAGSLKLFEEDLDKHNYRELHWKKIPGRAMGMGYVEYLEDNQIARNETENLERKSHAVHSTPLWQTRDEDLAGKSTIVNYRPGQIIKANSEITPVVTEARNLPQFQETRQNWDLNTEKKTFTTDITSGQTLPSRTPLGVANLQATMSSSFFERKREELGLYLKPIVLEDIIPDFKRDTIKEHVMVFSCLDEESSYLDDAIADTLVGQKIVDYADKTGWFPSKEEREYLRLQVKDRLKGKKNRYLKIPDGFWAMAKYILDINFTGESSDVSVKSQLVQLVLQIQGTNPAALQDPNSRNLIFKLLALGGLNPAELGLTWRPQEGQQPAPVAGSLAKPAGPVQGQFRVTQQI